MLVEAPGSPAITPDIDIRDRFLDSGLIANIRYQIVLASLHSGSIDQRKVTIYYQWHSVVYGGVYGSL
jgi:hypothetical protein